MEKMTLIKAILYDSEIAGYGGLFDALDGDSMRLTFGDVHWAAGEGVIAGKTYFYLYACDCQEYFRNTYAPDIVLERDHPEDYDKEDRLIYLWKIE